MATARKKSMGTAAVTAAARPTALITGASSGIGEALAGIFAQTGHDLILVARSADKLQALALDLAAQHGVKVLVEPVDLSLSGAPAQLAATLKRKKRKVDVLVNNAGVLSQGAFASMKPAVHQQMIALNTANYCNTGPGFGIGSTN